MMTVSLHDYTRGLLSPHNRCSLCSLLHSQQGRGAMPNIKALLKLGKLLSLLRQLKGFLKGLMLTGIQCIDLPATACITRMPCTAASSQKSVNTAGGEPSQLSSCRVGTQEGYAASPASKQPKCKHEESLLKRAKQGMVLHSRSNIATIQAC